MTTPPPLPARRRLAHVLRDRLASSSSAAVLNIGAVTAAPDSKHVTVTIAGSNVTVPRLASYTAPVVGEACYLLSAGGLTIALGAVR